MGDFVESLLHVILPSESGWTKRWVRMFVNKVVWAASELAEPQGELPISAASTVVVRFVGDARFDLRFDATKSLQCRASSEEECDGWVRFLLEAGLKLVDPTPPTLPISPSTSSSTSTSVTFTAAAAAPAAPVSVDVRVVIAALITEAVANEQFEACVPLREYKKVLDQIDEAVKNEEYERCVELRAEKKKLEDKLPQIAVKKKQLEEQQQQQQQQQHQQHPPLPQTPVPTPAPPKSASPVPQKPANKLDDIKKSMFATSPTPNSMSASPKRASTGKAALTDAEREALWAKFAPKAETKKPEGARTSWDSGFTVQAAAEHENDDDDDDDDDDDEDDDEDGTPAEKTVRKLSSGSIGSSGGVIASSTAAASTPKKKKKKPKKKSSEQEAPPAGEKTKKKKKKKVKKVEEAAPKKKKAKARSSLTSTWGGTKESKVAMFERPKKKAKAAK